MRGLQGFMSGILLCAFIYVAGVSMGYKIVQVEELDYLTQIQLAEHTVGLK